MIKRFISSAGAFVLSEDVGSPLVTFINPSAPDKAALQSIARIDEHTLSSALDPDEVSRMEVHDDHLLLIWKRPRNYSAETELYFEVSSVGLVLTKERLAVVAADEIELPSIKSWQPRGIKSPVDILLYVLLGSIHHYTGHLKAIKLIARDLQAKINMSMENKHLIQMFNLSESLTYYMNAINGNGVVLSRLRAYMEKQGDSAGDVLSFVDDLIIENNQCFKQAEIYSDIFSGLMDARGTLVNNNMNVLLKNLTVINTIFLPLNLIASILGMSEFTAMTAGVDWRISYSLLTIGMVVVGWFTWLLLKHAGPEATRRKPRTTEKD